MKTSAQNDAVVYLLEAGIEGEGNTLIGVYSSASVAIVVARDLMSGRGIEDWLDVKIAHIQSKPETIDGDPDMPVIWKAESNKLQEWEPDCDRFNDDIDPEGYQWRVTLGAEAESPHG